MAETITIGTVTFIVAPEEVSEPKPAPKPKPRQIRRPSAPQCSPSRSTLPPSKLGPDGYYHMGSIADSMWREKRKGRLERWGILKTWEE